MHSMAVTCSRFGSECSYMVVYTIRTGAKKSEVIPIKFDGVLTLSSVCLPSPVPPHYDFPSPPSAHLAPSLIHVVNVLRWDVALDRELGGCVWGVWGSVCC